MNKDEAMKLLWELTDAITDSYRIANGHKRGSIPKAQARERKAIKEVFRHLTPDVIEDSDLALYW